MPQALFWTYAAVAGALVGSFLNVCIQRLPSGESIIVPRSRCPGCEQTIAWYDNIPVLSFLLLRGRCRGCSESISAQYPLIEIATALLWAAAFARFGFSIEGLRSAIFLTLLLGIAMTDAKHMVIPDHLSLGGMVIGLACAAVPGGFPLGRAAAGAAIGYGLLWTVSKVAERAFGKPALGLGDVHMMAMVGAFVGVSGSLLTIFLGSLLGLIVGVPMMWLKGRLTFLGTYLPLGTYLAVGAAIAHGWGDAMVAWYLEFALGG